MAEDSVVEDGGNIAKQRDAVKDYIPYRLSCFQPCQFFLKPKAQLRARLPINLPPVPNRHHQHDKSVIVDGGDHTIIANPVAP